MKVRMLPHPDLLSNTSNGIARVVQKYVALLPQFGVEVVAPNATSYDLEVGHAAANPGAAVHHSHGLLWQDDRKLSRGDHEVNRELVQAIRAARLITVPSKWVQGVFQRDMRLSPHVVPHGVDFAAWQRKIPHNEGYLFYGKNRQTDGLSSAPLLAIAQAFPDLEIVTTIAPPGADHYPQIKEVGVLPPEQIKVILQEAALLLSCDLETFGIMPLEAMASGVPVLTTHRGAVPELVGHQPGLVYHDEAEMLECVDFILKRRSTLSQVMIGIAEGYSWERAVEQVAGLYQELFEPIEQTAAIVITGYNNEKTIGLAIGSAAGQSFGKLVDIIVVDDGSADDTGAIAQSWLNRDSRVRYIRQDNAGVAIARNRGLYHTQASYIAFLDADDQMEPGYLAYCVEALRANPNASTAYTGIRAILTENGHNLMPHDWQGPLAPGEVKNTHPWPHEFNYDDQISYKNQVPTGAVFRRESLLRVGGFRQRYAPRGAGEEDAEINVRLGAMGQTALYLPPKDNALFIHTHGSGTVSGNPSHQETDWLAWHPWARDGQHPFASLATPPNGIAHPVRSYDNPLISVIIPVGPGHERLVANALDSLEAQTFRNWEAVVVWDTPFFSPEIDRIKQAYPYASFHVSFGLGSGEARNLGIDQARAPLLAFLDADDTYRPDYLARMLDVFMQTGNIPYAEFYGQVESAQPESDPFIIRQGKLVDWNERTKMAVFEGHYQDFDCKLARAEPTGERPCVWCGINVLVPKAWSRAIGNFDESLETWEDCDWLLRLAWAGHCFQRIAEPLWVYNFSAGQRREKQETRPAIMERLREKHKMAIVGWTNSDCGCGPVPIQEFDMSDSGSLPALVGDGNHGTHNIVGGVSQKQYGYLAHGEPIVGGVLKEDIRSRPWVFICAFCNSRFQVTEGDVCCTCGGAKSQAIPAPQTEELVARIQAGLKAKIAEETIPAETTWKVIEPGDNKEWKEVKEKFPALAEQVEEERKEAPLPELNLEIEVTDETPLRYLGVIDKGRVRTLKAAGVTNVGQARAKGRDGLLAIKGIGESTVDLLLGTINKALQKQP